MRLRTVVPTVTLGLFLAACGSSYGSGYGGAGQPAAGTGATSSGNPGGAVSALMTRSSGLGTIVTDGTGRTLYKFDKDTRGASTSACTGACLSLWPPAHEGTTLPKLSGITGMVATITGSDGKTQLTTVSIGDHGTL